MEETIQSTVNSGQSTVEQKKQFTVHGSQSTFLVTLLSVLLLISCLIAGFFAYQTQNLVKELTKLQVKPVPTSNSNVPDLSKDSKEYRNTKWSYTFEVPSIFVYPKEILPADSNVFATRDGVDSPLSISTGDLLLESIVYPNLDSSSLQKVRTGINSMKGDIVDQPFQPIGELEKISDTNNLNIKGSIFKESTTNKKEVIYFIAFWETNNNVYVIKMFALPDKIESIQEMFIQTVSSFVYIEPEQVACTMEAKVCPDGSSVGRSGPKCEFAACPTTSPQP